ncbi:ferritin [Janibacter alkaliphilus]|uniref:Ferritin n=1 Tax=Janibacter alkaliphilus TaxID=1069963 RepID=A0A852X812_9MICO|nr:ferritin [Janibacter alkaliphilus]NYG38558.1 ferritin [Janibacter alkaliphilus]
MTSRFIAQLNTQIGEEFAAHQQYVAVAAHYDALTMPQMAGLFFRQAKEERGHAMMMIRYLLDVDAPVEIPAVEAPTSVFDGVVPPVELALAQERRVTEQIHTLTQIAREEGDFAAEQFMQWFIKEQVEEVATMQDLLAVVQRSGDDLNDIENYVERELSGSDDDPTAPPMADA